MPTTAWTEAGSWVRAVWGEGGEGRGRGRGREGGGLVEAAGRGRGRYWGDGGEAGGEGGGEGGGAGGGWGGAVSHTTLMSHYYIITLYMSC